MNIFIAKLSSSTTSEGLVEIFQQFGEVKNAKVIIDRETGTSKGYGFVEMANDEEGATAIAELNDSELDGNVIVVKESQPKPAGGGFGGRGNSGGFRPGGGSSGGGGGDRFKRPSRPFSNDGGDRKPFRKDFKSKGDGSRFSNDEF
ncbi:MAG TPA: RNA-binding protein [Saprospiraceae bacterium]|nr:RNA-binding protein [Saprospiraceae bacterium]HQW56990.1 RNA-binding protein [Saprospiraceae bacterium]